jgi:hypothetical protein
MSTQETKQRLGTVKDIALELKLSESRIRAYLGKNGSPDPVKLGQFYGGGRTANLYDIEKFKVFYRKSVNSKVDRTETKSVFNNELAKAFLGGRR